MALNSLFPPSRILADAGLIAKLELPPLMVIVTDPFLLLSAVSVAVMVADPEEEELHVNTADDPFDVDKVPKPLACQE